MPSKFPSDTQTVGGGGFFAVLCSASSESEGWSYTTRAMDFVSGALVQTTTERRNPDGSFALSEALAFVPGVKLVGDASTGYRLVANYYEEEN